MFALICLPLPGYLTHVDLRRVKPGALLSRDVAESMTDYCTSVVVGKVNWLQHKYMPSLRARCFKSSYDVLPRCIQDWVPRFNYANVHALWDSLMMASTHSRIPKFVVTWAGLFGCIGDRCRDRWMFRETEDLPEEPAKASMPFCPSSLCFDGTTKRALPVAVDP